MRSWFEEFDIAAPAFDGAQILLSLPAHQVLGLGIGLLLMALIVRLLLTAPAAPRAAVRPSSTCLRCGQSLADRGYADRRLPTWVICAGCYERRPAGERRHFRAR